MPSKNQHQKSSMASSSSSSSSSVLSVFILFLVVLQGAQLGVYASCTCTTTTAAAAAVAATTNTSSVHDVLDGSPDRYITWDDIRFSGDAGVVGGDGNGVRTIYVAKNGLGHTTTVQGAVDMVPENNNQRVKIVIFYGIYRERVHIPANKPYISFIGNPDYETVITYNAKASDKDSSGREIGTYGTATVEVESDYFCATGITVQNTINAAEGGVGMQAVALKISGDKAFFYKVRLLGSQDTLLDLRGSHYFLGCYIEGLVDFICGNGRSIYKDCVLHSTAVRSGAIAAHHRDTPHDTTGFSFVNCTVTGTGKILLGRAWGPYARTIYSHCQFADIIDHEGWSDWGQPERRETVSFGEYRCAGRGANRRGRAPWSKSLTYSEAKPFLNTSFIYGDEWLRL